MSERKRESNAIIWEITEETIWNKNFEWVEMTFKNKILSRSSKSSNLTLSKFIHQQNNDKISLETNKKFEDFVYKFVTNQ